MPDMLGASRRTTRTNFRRDMLRPLLMCLAMCQVTFSTDQALFVNMTVSSMRVMEDMHVRPSNRRLYLLVMLPLHGGDDADGLRCGQVRPAQMETLAGIMHEVDTLNSASSSERVGAIVIDTCASDIRTVADLFELFAAQSHSLDAPTKADLIAVVRSTYAWSESLDRVVRSLQVPIVNVDTTPHSLATSTPLHMGTTPTDLAQLSAITSVLHRMDWTFVNVVYEASRWLADSDTQLRQLVNAVGVCVDRSLAMQPWSTVYDAQLIVRRLILSEARVIVLVLSEQTTKQFVKAMAMENVTPGRFVLVSRLDDDWLQDTAFNDILRTFEQGWLLLQYEAKHNHDFAQDFSHMTPASEGGLLPSRWLADYWQWRFKCSLQSSTASGTKFSQLCTGLERVNASSLAFGQRVDAGKIAVRSLWSAMAALRRHRCPGVHVNRLADCVGTNAGIALATYLRQTTLSYPSSTESDRVEVSFDENGFPSNVAIVVSKLERAANGAHSLIPVGLYQGTSSGGSLTLQQALVTLRDSRGVQTTPTSVCTQQCHRCIADTAFARHVESKRGSRVRMKGGASDDVDDPDADPSISFESLLDTRTVVITSLALLGILICIACLVYFRRSMTPCGSVLVVGLVLMYSMAIVYALPSTHITCHLRRVLTGVAAMTVFAPLFTQAVYTWSQQFQAKPSARPPIGLLIATLSLIAVQLIVAAEWTLLDTWPVLERVVAVDGMVESISHSCAPHSSFTTHIALSLGGCAVIAFAALLFSALSARLAFVRSGDHGCVAVSIALVLFSWTLFYLLRGTVAAGMLPIVISGLLMIDATLILTALFVRRAYVHYSTPTTRAKPSTAAANPSLSRPTLRRADVVKRTNPTPVGTLPTKEEITKPDSPIEEITTMPDIVVTKTQNDPTAVPTTSAPTAVTRSSSAGVVTAMKRMFETVIADHPSAVPIVSQRDISRANSAMSEMSIGTTVHRQVVSRMTNGDDVKSEETVTKTIIEQL